VTWRSAPISTSLPSRPCLASVGSRGCSTADWSCGETTRTTAEAAILSGLTQAEQKKLAESLRRLGLSLDEATGED
jgi:hypothetical protein